MMPNSFHCECALPICEGTCHHTNQFSVIPAEVGGHFQHWINSINHLEPRLMNDYDSAQWMVISVLIHDMYVTFYPYHLPH